MGHKPTPVKRLLTPRWLIIKLTGLLFIGYAAYNVFIIFRDIEELPVEGIIISAVVAALFTVFALFAWTAGVRVTDAWFLMIRRAAFAIIVLSIAALKLRMVGAVVDYMDMDEPHTVFLYGFSYFMTLAGMLVLLVYYLFIHKRIPPYPIANVVLPLIALALFLCSFVLEIILYFAHGIGLEANAQRTIVMRPVFYLGFICLSAYFLFPPHHRKDAQKNAKTAQQAKTEA